MFISTNLIMDFVLFFSLYPFLIETLQFFLVNENLKRLVLIVQSTTIFLRFYIGHKTQFPTNSPTWNVVFQGRNASQIWMQLYYVYGPLSI